jgi:ferritin
MLKKRIEQELNEQAKKESYSSHLYLALAAWSEANGYAGIAKWLYAQADEERDHMLRFMKYITERGGNAKVMGIDEPAVNHKSIKHMFEQILSHEEYISASINVIVAVCIEEKDFTTQNWIQWFVNEQIEEEASVQDILDKLNLLDEKNLYLFDRDIMSMRANNSNDSANG